ncbi:hypothetical protein PR202_ga03184 [Eleusine coracana subsp. coracana]|uniref:Protein kinase domain-containing protein n=1 Tax=Eleusine coracana subsp. coracana TaxID=191504 RepID=A0AAV5BNL8_ELECO|nr:hypothetical protein QOZ80_2BG0203720 [Eleusine coracana subsp. coracana]GJM87248.1 hypothetical protein PR202_ga03184 [Eleusine coracana subsp. coracana]
MAPAAATGGGSEAEGTPRMVKFLCSFGGRILPRPLDGCLRYVGGDTRIIMLPWDISYADLAARMRELYKDADIIKYQQPDEDLDALVSVVNDDDVVNMMEEYDKVIALGEAFTRLRIFLFSHLLDDDAASAVVHYNVDERETERRYVDALNNLGDVRSPSSPVSVEQLFGIGGNESGMPDFTGLRHLNVPRPSHSQRYGEMDSPWSPAYVSPGQYGVHDPRDFPISPSSARFQVGAEDFDERIPDDFVRQSPKYRHYETAHSPSHIENLVWLPPGTTVQQNAGFPGNLGCPNNFLDGSTVCDHCRSPFQKGQGSVTDPRYIDPRWTRAVQPHFGQPSMTNECPGNSCPNCCRPGEHYVGGQDARVDNGVYVKEQNGGHAPVFYNEPHSHDRAWHVHASQSHQRYEDPRLHLPGNGRLIEPYIIDGNSVNSAFAPNKIYDMHSASLARSSHESPHYFHGSTELINDTYHNQQVGVGSSFVQPSGFEESSAQHYNHSSTYGADSFYQMQQNLPPIQSLRRRANSPVHTGSPYDSPHLPIPNGGVNTNLVRNMGDVSPRIPGLPAYDRMPNPWTSPNGNVPYRVAGHDVPAAMENTFAHDPRSNLTTAQYVQPFVAPESVQHQPGAPLREIHPERGYAEPMLQSYTDGKVAVSVLPPTNQLPTLDSNTMKKHERLDDERSTRNVNESTPSPAVNEPSTLPQHVGTVHDVDLKQEKPTEHENETGATAMQECGDISEDRLNFLPELIASVKKAALEDAADTRMAQLDANAVVSPVPDDDDNRKKLDDATAGNNDANQDSDVHGSSDQHRSSKIEATTAEAEALSKGLQTIKNDDLEEIKELGSGTYGAVFHGKWRGCDVAIKRIKASCFAGRPSERERLIADFWKEALILSSLHHPNVVSFYGVVRDGPDGSLATVTEFMVNGSLKQFLRKKDRTIDRRKRVILAMDAAFGMEYLHGKNIVHFDLKCENLLVNMRDPQRPICKIGDLGLSKVKQHTLVSGGVRGTLPWMAPELLSGKSNMVSEKIDVYSFGIVMWELLTGEEPYSDMRAAEIIGGIVNDSLRPRIPSWCDPEWKALMQSCWASDPADRPAFTDISQRLRKMAVAMNVK